MGCVQNPKTEKLPVRPQLLSLNKQTKQATLNNVQPMSMAEKKIYRKKLISEYEKLSKFENNDLFCRSCWVQLYNEMKQKKIRNELFVICQQYEGVGSTLSSFEEINRIANDYHKRSHDCCDFCGAKSFTHQLVRGDVIPLCTACDGKGYQISKFKQTLQSEANTNYFQQTQFNSQQKGQCVICLERKSSLAGECGHLCVCEICVLKLSECPLCRSKGKFRKIFPST